VWWAGTVHRMGERVVSISREIDAPAERIFELLADPSRHGEIDGSGMVQAAKGGAQRLTLGAKFGMDMKFGPIPYGIKNTVVEFKDDRLIAWAHFGGHRWRYRLEPLGDERTKVTEEFDWSTSKLPKAIELMGYPKQHVGNIERTLERLAKVVES
jgi:uncharacterized protein YndB with AHSA1/START domain